MRANDLVPAFPTHPGDILKDELECRGITEDRLAEGIGLPLKQLSKILNAEAPLDERTALLLEAALGISAEPLMRLQITYNIQTARKDVPFLERLGKVHRVASVL